MKFFKAWWPLLLSVALYTLMTLSFKLGVNIPIGLVWWLLLAMAIGFGALLSLAIQSLDDWK